MSTSQGKRIPCHPQCTRCKGVLVSRSTKTRHTKDIQDRLHTSSLEIAPKVAIPTFAQWNSRRGNEEEEYEDTGSLDGDSSEGSRPVKRFRRTSLSALDPGTGGVSYFNSPFGLTAVTVYINHLN